MNLYSETHIFRIYDRGVEAVVHLVHRLTDKIEDLETRLICQPETVIASLSKELIKTKRNLARQSDELRRERQLNHQLLRRLRELEHEVERTTTTERDSHNSSLPPALDLPWKKITRTRSLRQKSGLKVGGQFGHPGTTLRQVANPDCVILHTPEACSQCNAALPDSRPLTIIRRQVFDIIDGRVKVTDIGHRLIIAANVED